MTIYNKVYNQYLNNIYNLPPYESFHLSSRLFLICGDKKAKKYLDEISKQLSKKSLEEIWEILDTYLTNTIKITHQLTRQKYLNLYPTIRRDARCLFIYIFAKSIFKIDISSLMQKKLSDDVTETYRKLTDDNESIGGLSAFALNFLILYGKLILNDHNVAIALLNKQKVFFPKLNNKFDIEMYIYFITHVIIADCLFYTDKINPNNKILFIKNLKIIEKIIINEYQNIHLDIKFEFLVCAKLCQYESILKDKIYNEAESSISESGNFLVDTINSYPQKERSDFISSEHRNVLFLAAYYQ